MIVFVSNYTQIIKITICIYNVPKYFMHSITVSKNTNGWSLLTECHMIQIIYTKMLKSGNSDWSGCSRSTRKQTVPDNPSNRL